ncbi:hypothetical protein LINPERHAP1_LOCUS37551 [Linum perenne]
MSRVVRMTRLFCPLGRHTCIILQTSFVQTSSRITKYVLPSSNPSTTIELLGSWRFEQTSSQGSLTRSSHGNQGSCSPS